MSSAAAAASLVHGQNELAPSAASLSLLTSNADVKMDNNGDHAIQAPPVKFNKTIGKVRKNTDADVPPAQAGSLDDATAESAADLLPLRKKVKVTASASSSQLADTAQSSVSHAKSASAKPLANAAAAASSKKDAPVKSHHVTSKSKEGGKGGKGGKEGEDKKGASRKKTTAHPLDFVSTILKMVLALNATVDPTWHPRLTKHGIETQALWVIDDMLKKLVSKMVTCSNEYKYHGGLFNRSDRKKASQLSADDISNSLMVCVEFELRNKVYEAVTEVLIKYKTSKNFEGVGLVCFSPQHCIEILERESQFSIRPEAGVALAAILEELCSHLIKQIYTSFREGTRSEFRHRLKGREEKKLNRSLIADQIKALEPEIDEMEEAMYQPDPNTGEVQWDARRIDAKTIRAVRDRDRNLARTFPGIIAGSR